MTRNAYRSLLLPFLLAAILVATPTSLRVGAASSANGGDDLVKLRQEIRKLEQEIEALDKKIEETKAKLLKTKESLKGQHEKAFNRGIQLEAGKKVKAWLDASPALDSAEKYVDGLQETLAADFGAAIVQAARDAMIEIFANMMDEEMPPESETRCALAIAESFQLAFDSDFEAAWEKTLKLGTREWADLEELERERRDKQGQLEIKRRLQTATISARVPPGMVPVPRANNITLGWNTDTILDLSRKLQDDPEKNKFCLLATPPVSTSIDEFMIDQFEVTHLAYWYFCQTTGHRAPRALAGTRTLPNGKVEPIWVEMWPGGKIPPGMERFPITFVSREDAEAYCKWTGCRLPTEFEWEVAARSGENGYDGRIWPWGNEYDQQRCNDATSLANPAREKAFLAIPADFRDKMAGVVPVGTFDAGRTPLGLQDMAGNVAEWTASSFLAYEGFQGEMTVAKGEKISLPVSKFSENIAVFRGGHCDQRDMVVSAVFRGFEIPQAPLKYVGFRRARSGMAGLDQMRFLMRNGRLDSRLQDFPLCKTDQKEKRILPQLDLREGKYAIVEKFDWNEDLQVPGAAHQILLINRDTMDIDSYAQMKRETRGDEDIGNSFLVGVLHTDVAFSEPPLEAGTWFVTFKAGRKYKDETTKKTVKLEDALIFVPEKTGAAAFRMDLKGSEVFIPDKQKTTQYKTKLVPISLADNAGARFDELVCTFSFDATTGSNPKQVLVEFKLRADKGALADYE